MGLAALIGVRIILIERGEGRNRRLLARNPDTVLQAGDALLLDLDLPGLDMAALCEQYKVNLLPASESYSSTALTSSAWSRSSCRRTPASRARRSPRPRNSGVPS